MFSNSILKKDWFFKGKRLFLEFLEKSGKLFFLFFLFFCFVLLWFSLVCIGFYWFSIENTMNLMKNQYFDGLEEPA